jgi:putative SOS response-associated peptidase YedK
MCGKASVSHLSWAEIFDYASSLKAPNALPSDPKSRINISPSRLRRKSEPDSMVWETLPVIYSSGQEDRPIEAIWPFIPAYSEGRLPYNKQGRLISTANARLRTEGAPFAPTFTGAWNKGARVLVVVSWFYEFDGRARPQVPYAVFPMDAPFWMMAGLARGHHRSPALLRDPEEAMGWLRGDKAQALKLLRPFSNETMGVEAVPMGIKIPGNENVELPGALRNRG